MTEKSPSFIVMEVVPFLQVSTSTISQWIIFCDGTSLSSTQNVTRKIRLVVCYETNFETLKLEINQLKKIQTKNRPTRNDFSGKIV